MKFRHNGVPIGILVFALLAILNFIKVKKIKTTAIFIASFICIYVLTSIPGWIYLKQSNIVSAAGVLTSTKIYCMGGILNSDINIEDEERETLNKILDIDAWKENYNEYSGNGILFNDKINMNAINEKDTLDKFNNIFNKYASQRPNIIIKHFILINSIWWNPKELAPMNTVVTNNDYLSELTNGEYDNKPVSNELNNKIFNYIVFTLSHKKIYTVLYRPAIPLFLSIIGVAYIMIKNKKIGYALIVLPMLLNIGTYVFIMSSQDHRYFYPNYMTCYFVILLITSMLTKEENQEKMCKIKNKVLRKFKIRKEINEKK